MYNISLRLIYPTIYPKIRLKSVATLVKSGYSTKYEKSMVNCIYSVPFLN